MSLDVTFVLNGIEVTANIDPAGRLLDLLRDSLRMTGTKEGCGEGECGACTVIVDGLVVDSCLVPVCQVDGSEIRTVEGLSDAELRKLCSQNALRVLGWQPGAN